MNRIGFITTPLTSGHAVRGIGFYTRRLLAHISPLAPDFGFEIVEIKNQSELKDSDFAIVHYPFFDLFKASLPPVKTGKTVVTIHDVIPLEYPDHYPPGIRGWINLQLQKLALGGVSTVITDSNASAKSINTYLNVPENKIKVIYLAADETFKKVAKPENTYHLPSRFILYVGDVNYNKNVPALILACKQIATPLVIVGKNAATIESQNLDHPQLSHLKAVDWAGVTRLDFVDDLVDIYNLATVYCQPSFAEGSALTILEAMACLTPVACSDIPVFHEHAGNSAVYFDPYSIESIANALAHPKKPKIPAFSWDKTARETLQTYKDLL